MLIALLPYSHVLPSSSDFQMSACKGPVDWLPARLHSYTAFDRSVKTQVSPLDGSAVVACGQGPPWVGDLYKSVPPPRGVSYRPPLGFVGVVGSPPRRPAFR